MEKIALLYFHRLICNGKLKSVVPGMLGIGHIMVAEQEEISHLESKYRNLQLLKSCPESSRVGS